jgi:radical SAM-linked protein
VADVRSFEVKGFRGINARVHPMNDPPTTVQRLRLTFSKYGSARYISHLDLARTLERALNRARLPLAYSQGFNRRPRLSLAAALPLGYTSEAELADVWLVETIEPSHFQERLKASMAPGIDLLGVEQVALNELSLQQMVIASAYEIRFLDPQNDEYLHKQVSKLLDSESIPWERKRPKNNQTQVIDLRPLILELNIVQLLDQTPLLLMELAQTPEQTGRPDDVLTAMGFDPLDSHIHRKNIVLRSDPQTGSAYGE